MNQNEMQVAGWYKAITLSERFAPLRTMGDDRVDWSSELAQERLDRWRSQEPFTNGDYFRQRLEAAGLTEADFTRLLAEPMEAIQARFASPPGWLETLQEAFSRPGAFESTSKESLAGLFPRPKAFDPVPVSERPQYEKTVGFLNLVAPLIRLGQERLRSGIQVLICDFPDPPFDPDTVEDILWAGLPAHLLWMVSRTLVLELHVARLRGQLSGDSPEEQFQSFADQLSRPETALAIFQEYPVLARQLEEAVDRHVAFRLEFLDHLCRDWAALCETFSPEADPGLLQALEGGAGDTHRGGRSVAIARFSSGFRLVYKPRSLAMDLHFQGFLAWLNQRGDHPPFRTLRCLDREDHGWLEFVAFQECRSPAEVRRFYRRLGGYLAILYGLAASDFHSENLIAAGEHPVLIDLETFFIPTFPGVDSEAAGEGAVEEFSSSVMGTLMLPQLVWASPDSDGVDISGLGRPAGQLSPFAAPGWEAAGTGDMRFIRQRKMLGSDDNQPRLNGQAVSPIDYQEAIIGGFAGVYQTLLDHRETLLSENGPLAAFAGDEVRVVMRNTRTYGRLLEESFHPDALRDALDRDRLFDKLWIMVQHLPYLSRIVASEHADLHSGDIPLFTTRPTSRHLWSSHGHCIPDLFPESGLSRVQSRIQGLNQADMDKQQWFIRASLSTLAKIPEQVESHSYHLKEPATRAELERLLAAATAVADRLEALALMGEGNVSWIGLRMTGRERWTLEPLGADLYDGLPGVALFLGYLGAVTQEERYTNLAKMALNTIRRQLERFPQSVLAIGGFDGWGGLIYALTHLGLLWGQDELLEGAVALVEKLPELIEKDERLDIIGGAAGCIGALLTLYRVVPDESVLAAAVQCGDHLIAQAAEMPESVGWITDLGEKPLTGFAHGAAGIAWALLKLAEVSGQAGFRDTALAAIAYERSLFSREKGNWPDLRQFRLDDEAVEATDRFATFWCHGAPGIGLARLRAKKFLDDPMLELEISSAVQTTLAHSFGQNHSICHGDLGNLELLVEAGQALEMPELEVEVDRLAGLILESFDSHGWLCGNPTGVESPGLMTGLAGIGYGLLRLAAPAQVPSVLMLDPPPGKSDD